MCDASNYADNCCSPEKPCAAGKGDCDADDDCIGSLVCDKQDNCGQGFPDNADCCYAKSESGIPKIIQIIDKLSTLKCLKLGSI